MCIACPSCNTNFIIQKEQLGNSGKKVKCSKCNHVWYQKLNDSLKSEKLLQEQNVTTSDRNNLYLANGINVPALLPIKSSKCTSITYILGFSLIILLFLILFHTNFIVIPLFKGNSLVIDNINIENNIKAGKIRLAYKITNFSNNIVSIPLIQVRLLDATQTVIKSYIVDRMNINLSPKQYVNMNSEIDLVPNETEQLDIMLSNRCTLF